MERENNFEVKPLARWEDEEVLDEGKLVWWTRLDKKYQIEVHRLDEELGTNLKIQQQAYDPGYQGVLCIFDHQNEDELLHYEPVSLSYGAIFGPDIDDVNLWQSKVIDFVDNELPRHNEQ